MLPSGGRAGAVQPQAAAAQCRPLAAPLLLPIGLGLRAFQTWRSGSGGRGPLAPGAPRARPARGWMSALTASTLCWLCTRPACRPSRTPTRPASTTWPSTRASSGPESGAAGAGGRGARPRAQGSPPPLPGPRPEPAAARTPPLQTPSASSASVASWWPRRKGMGPPGRAGGVRVGAGRRRATCSRECPVSPADAGGAVGGGGDEGPAGCPEGGGPGGVCRVLGAWRRSARIRGRVLVKVAEIIRHREEVLLESCG